MAQHMIRPQQIDALPLLEPGLKTQYKAGLTNLWTQFEAQPEGSQLKQELKSKIITASHRIMQSISQRNKPGQNGQARPAQNGMAGAAQNAAGQVQGQQTQQAQQQAAQAQQLNTQQQGQPASADDALRARISAEVNAFTVGPRPNETNAADFNAFKADFKTQLGSWRYKQEKAKETHQVMQRHIQQLQSSGQPISEEIKQRFNLNRTALVQSTEKVKSLTDNNTKNIQAAQAAQARKAQNNQAAQAGNGDQQRPGTQQGFTNGAQDQMNASAQQPGQPGFPGNQQQQQRAMQNPNAQTQNQLSQQQMQQPQRPPINPVAVQQYSSQYGSAPNSGMPQSATATPQLAQPPRALSQQGAIAKAQEQVLQQQTGAHPQQTQPQPGQQPAQVQQHVQNGAAFNQQPQSQGTPTSGMPTQPQSALNPKFPIPKQLNLGPQTQTPVAGPAARPTMGQNGMMNMPGVQKPPPFTLEGEGDHVLSKRKLDELVRQVTGSANPADGLTPEVEEAVLSMTDDFVDNVITKACQLAKLRQGQTLDIRDVQMVLERNYGIRIPGYSLDEVRTVRKFQPAPGWVAKVQAVQAGKVMGGNRDA